MASLCKEKTEELLKNIKYQENRDEWILRSYISHVKPMLDPSIDDMDRAPVEEWDSLQSLKEIQYFFSNEYINKMLQYWKKLTQDTTNPISPSYIYCLFPLKVRITAKLVYKKDYIDDPSVLVITAATMIQELEKHSSAPQKQQKTWPQEKPNVIAQQPKNIRIPSKKALILIIPD